MSEEMDCLNRWCKNFKVHEIAECSACEIESLQTALAESERKRECMVVLCKSDRKSVASTCEPCHLALLDKLDKSESNLIEYRKEHCLIVESLKAKLSESERKREEADTTRFRMHKTIRNMVQNMKSLREKLDLCESALTSGLDWLYPGEDKKALKAYRLMEKALADIDEEKA